MLEQTVPPHWEGGRYCWVVLCKNRWFHLRHNFFFNHKIPLGITDDFAPRPTLDDHFVARCDECGKEHLYNPRKYGDPNKRFLRISLHTRTFGKSAANQQRAVLSRSR